MYKISIDEGKYFYRLATPDDNKSMFDIYNYWYINSDVVFVEDSEEGFFDRVKKINDKVVIVSDLDERTLAWATLRKYPRPMSHVVEYSAYFDYRYVNRKLGTLLGVKNILKYISKFCNDDFSMRARDALGVLFGEILISYIAQSDDVYTKINYSYSIKNGLKEYGRIPKMLEKNGKRFDLVLMSINV
jgi:hypothetical protein